MGFGQVLPGVRIVRDLAGDAAWVTSAFHQFGERRRLVDALPDRDEADYTVCARSNSSTIPR